MTDPERPLVHPMARMDLSSPLRLRNGALVRNRVWLAPMTNQQSHLDGSLSDAEQRWLEMRADGGFGVVETCASHVARDGQAWEGELGIFDDALLPGLTRLASSLRARGAMSLVQLFHGGVRASSKLTGEQVWSASTWTEDTPNFEAPRAGTEDDILRTIAAFADAARRAERAGFDGVELHGAHGYLLCQFLSVTMNRRDDRWGGAAFEDRARLLRESVRAVRAVVSKGFVVGVRISPEDFGNARGLDLDESLELAKWLVADGIDFLHLSLWDAARNTVKRPDVHAVPLFRAVVSPEVPLVVAGTVWTREEGESVLARGADAIALGRSAIANPDWPLRIAEPAWEPRRPPLTRAELGARGLSPAFAEYMTRWKGFVAEG